METLKLNIAKKANVKENLDLSVCKMRGFYCILKTVLGLFLQPSYLKVPGDRTKEKIILTANILVLGFFLQLKPRS